MIKPLADRVVVKVIAEEAKTSSGLIIPGNAKEKPQEGVVIAVGKGQLGEDNERVPLDVAPGDKVMFGKYSGTEFKFEGEEFLIMHQDDILGIL